MATNVIGQIACAIDVWKAETVSGSRAGAAIVMHSTMLEPMNQDPRISEILRQSQGKCVDTIDGLPIYVCDSIFGACVVGPRGLLSLKMVGARRVGSPG